MIMSHIKSNPDFGAALPEKTQTGLLSYRSKQDLFVWSFTAQSTQGSYRAGELILLALFLSRLGSGDGGGDSGGGRGRGFLAPDWVPMLEQGPGQCVQNFCENNPFRSVV